MYGGVRTLSWVLVLAVAPPEALKVTVYGSAEELSPVTVQLTLCDCPAEIDAIVCCVEPEVLKPAGRPIVMVTLSAEEPLAVAVHVTVVDSPWYIGSGVLAERLTAAFTP